MSLNDLYFIVKRYWAVAVNINVFLVDFIYNPVLAKINDLREYFIDLCVNNRESVDWNEDLVTFTVDADTVIEVLVLVVGGELDVDIVCYA